MTVEPWRKRLRDEIDKTGRAYSDISKSAKLGTNFVEHFMKEEQQTSVRKVLALCDAIGADPTFIFGNVRLTADLKRLLDLVEGQDEKRIRSLIDVLDPR